MQDVNKVDMSSSEDNRKRMRRRKKNMTGYIILVILLALVVCFSLSVTMFFNLGKIVMTNGSQYDGEDIMKVSGIKIGDNLIRMDTEKARQNILDNLLYVDDVEIVKHYGHELEITVYGSKEKAYVQYRSGFMLISENWRILGFSEKPEKPDLMVIYGFNPSVAAEKDTLHSGNDEKSDYDSVLHELINEIDNQEIKDVKSIDCTDIYDIKVNFDDRIQILIGNSSDIPYKLRYAYHIITSQLRENKNGYLIYHDSLGYSYVSKEEYEELNIRAGINYDIHPSLPEVTLEPYGKDKYKNNSDDESSSEEVHVTDSASDYQ